MSDEVMVIRRKRSSSGSPDRKPSRDMSGPDAHKYARRPSKELRHPSRASSKSISEEPVHIPVRDPRLERRPSRDDLLERRGSKGSATSRSARKASKEAGIEEKAMIRKPSLNDVLGSDTFRRKSMVECSFDPERFADRKFLDDLFKCYDPNGDGTGSLGTPEFLELCKSLGLGLSKSEVKGLMKQLDLNGNGTIEMEEFHFFFNKARSRDDVKKQVDGMCGSKNVFIRKIFDEFKMADTGGIDIQGLRQLCRVCDLDTKHNKDGLSEAEIADLFQIMDVHKKGWITLDHVEFFWQNAKSRETMREMSKNVTRDNFHYLKYVYEQFDNSNCGEMTEAGLLSVCKFFGMQITMAGINQLLKQIDSNANGSVDVDEFVTFFRQVKNHEELQEEMAKLVIADARKKRLMKGIGWGSVLLIVVGIAMAQTGSASTVAAPIYFAGLLGLALTVIPVFLIPFIERKVVPYFQSCTVEKLVKLDVFMLIVGMSLAMARVILPQRAGSIDVGIFVCAGVIGASAAAAVLCFGCKGMGWLTADPRDHDDVDSPLSGEGPWIEPKGKGADKYAPDV